MECEDIFVKNSFDLGKLGYLEYVIDISDFKLVK